jgi:hypothetical protein
VLSDVVAGSGVPAWWVYTAVCGPVVRFALPFSLLFAEPWPTPSNLRIGSYKDEGEVR